MTSLSTREIVHGSSVVALWITCLGMPFAAAPMLLTMNLYQSMGLEFTGEEFVPNYFTIDAILILLSVAIWAYTEPSEYAEPADD